MAPDFAVLENLQPSTVVNAIGLINCQLDQPEPNFLLTNSLFPRRLADWCAAHEVPARVKVVVASVMQPTVEYGYPANASL